MHRPFPFRPRPSAGSVLIFALTAFLLGCTSSGKLENEGNLAALYQPDGSALDPRIQLRHVSDSSLRIDLEIDREQLLYMKGSTDKKFKSHLDLTYRLLGPQRAILDSGRAVLRDQKDADESGILRASIMLKGISGLEKAQLEIRYDDVNRKSGSSYLRTVTFSDPLSRSFFEKRSLDGRSSSSSWLKDKAPFTVHYLPKDTMLFVRVYTRDFPIAIPPYARMKDESFDFTPDSLFTVRSGDTLTLTQEGIYHFQVDTSQNDGFTLFRYPSGFPKVISHSAMAHPLRYISTQKEYEELAQHEKAADFQKAVDSFWLKAAGSIERGQELVAGYYGRVQLANERFSSYVEGWKTDRGIIYTIYGPPSEVYRNDKGETWVYGSSSSMLSYTFNFIHVSNPFTDNDYALNRLSEYRYGWGKAVSGWRNGKVYGIKDIQREQNARDAQLRRQRVAPTVWY